MVATARGRDNRQLLSDEIAESLFAGFNFVMQGAFNNV
jgi:hypothetical protein